MKAHELIGREFAPNEGVVFQVDEETGYIVQVDKADWIIDEDGPRVLLTYAVCEANDFLEMQELKYEWILPSHQQVEVVTNTWQQEPEEGWDCPLDCCGEPEDCEAVEGVSDHRNLGGLLDTLAPQYPAGRAVYEYEDYDGDVLTIGSTVVPSGELAASIDSDDTIIAVPRSEVANVILQLLEKVGVEVTKFNLAVDYDYQEHMFTGQVDVLGGEKHPGAYSAMVPTECVLADIAFMCHAYLERQHLESRNDDILGGDL